jgi:hypothetical protein
MLSDERVGLSFIIAAGPRQRSHSQIRVPRDSWHFTVSESRLPQPGGPGLRIYIPQEQGGPVIPQALCSLFVAVCYSQVCAGAIEPRLPPTSEFPSGLFLSAFRLKFCIH